MAITIKKLETFTGKRTSTMPDPDDQTKTVTEEKDCKDIEVEFTDGSSTHTRETDVCYDSEGNYDEEATDERISEVARGVEIKIAAGAISQE